MRKNNKQKNEIIIPKGIVLVNNKGEKFIINKKTSIKKALKKVIGGYDKVASIKYREGEKYLKEIERVDDELLTCKFKGENNFNILKSDILIEITNFYVLNYCGKLRFPNFEYIGHDYDVFKINRKHYKLEGIWLNKKLITIYNINEVERTITEIMENFQKIVLSSIVVRNIDTNELKVLNLDKINTEFEMGVPKITMKIKGFKGEKVIDLNEYSILFEMLYNLASMKIEYFTDA